MRWLCARPLAWTSRKANPHTTRSQFTTDSVPDELIKLYKSVVEINANANTALSRATKEANDGLSDFSLAVQMFKRQLMHDLETSSSKTQSYFEKLVKGMDSAVQSTVSKMSSVIRAAETDAANMSEVSHPDAANVSRSTLTSAYFAVERP